MECVRWDIQHFARLNDHFHALSLIGRDGGGVLVDGGDGCVITPAHVATIVIITTEIEPGLSSLFVRHGVELQRRTGKRPSQKELFLSAKLSVKVVENVVMCMGGYSWLCQPQRSVRFAIKSVGTIYVHAGGEPCREALDNLCQP